jgi:hypothetical protein
MSDTRKCRCLLCHVEETLRADLGIPDNQYAILLHSAPHLAVFSSPVALLSHLQSLSGKPASDEIFGELLDARALSPGTVFDSVLVLLFLPVLHSTVRRVLKRYPGLPREDTAQQALQTLLECLNSPEFRARRAFLGFALARRIRRATFEWAAREHKSPLETPGRVESNEMNSAETLDESFERTALLHHLLARAVERGTLTSSELRLLIQFKLEGGSENGSFSNAERQRLKRLLARLRRLTDKRHRTNL